jgi:hypothetical protein
MNQLQQKIAVRINVLIDTPPITSQELWWEVPSLRLESGGAEMMLYPVEGGFILCLFLLRLSI